MPKNKKLSPIFDAVGLASLVVSIFALAGSVWFVETATQGTLINAFQIAFAISISGFLVARMVQIVDVIRTTPDPKSLRVVAANEALSLDGDNPEVVVGEIRRAAWA